MEAGFCADGGTRRGINPPRPVFITGRTHIDAAGETRPALLMVSLAGFEPATLSGQHPKCCAYSSSATGTKSTGFPPAPKAGAFSNFATAASFKTMLNHAKA